MCIRCWAQYTEFVSNALPPAEWAALLPPVSELVTQYGVDFEVAFHVRCCSNLCLQTSMPHTRFAPTVKAEVSLLALAWWRACRM